MHVQDIEMDSMSTFQRGQASKNNESRVFDWDKAARLILERQPSVAGAGLSEDWEYTGVTIWREGKVCTDEFDGGYLASTWAIPQLDLDGEIIECYKMKHEVPDWDADTRWPQSALDILGASNEETEDVSSST